MEYGKRKPVMKRKPSVVIAIGMPKPDLKEQVAKKMNEEPEEADGELTCPKCGAELADTEENRAYAKMRADEMASEDEESEDED